MEARQGVDCGKRWNGRRAWLGNVEELAAVTLERLISVIGVLVLLGGILLTAGQQMERLNQLRAEAVAQRAMQEQVRAEVAALRADQAELRQKIESVMLFVGESEARRWREKRKAAR